MDNDIKSIIMVTDEVKKTAQKKYKCPYCDLRFERSKLHIHIQNKHEELIPEGYTALRVAFNTINNKTEGHCIMCGNVTDWNEDKGRYERLCNDPKCKENYKKMCAERNKKVYGTARLQTDPRYADEVQKKALEGRKGAGKYKFEDGGEHSYLGSYERKFLEFMDKVMHVKSEDLLSPGPTQYYMYNDEQHIYLPDFYYVPYNLIIEIKDGGSNPNNHPHRTGIDQEKLLAKEDAIRKEQKYNYARIVNNDFSQVMNIMAVIKYNIMANDKLTRKRKLKPVVQVNESSKHSDDYSKISKHYRKNSKNVNIEYFDFQEVKRNRSKYNWATAKMYESDRLSKANGLVAVDIDKEWQIGHVIVKKSKENNSDIILAMLYVNPKYRGYGISNVLVEAAINKYHANTVGVYEDNEVAIRLYKKYGFKIVEEKVEKETGLTYYIMRLDSGINEELMSGTIGAALPPVSHSQLIVINKNNQSIDDNDEDIENDDDIDEEDFVREWAETLVDINPNPVPYEANKDNYYLIQHKKDDKLSYGITKEPVKNIVYGVDSEKPGKYKVYKTDTSEIDQKYITFEIKDKQSARELYDELAKIESTESKEFYDSEYNDYIYSRLTEGSNIVSFDQLFFDNRFKLCSNPMESLKFKCSELTKFLKVKPSALDIRKIFPFADDIEYKTFRQLEDKIQSLKSAKDDNTRKSIKEEIASIGWNSEIPLNEESFYNFTNYNRNKIIDSVEISADDFINEKTELNSKKLASLKKKITPVFVVLSKGCEVMSKIIQKVTDSNWSHASIGFDSSLDEIYSFAYDIDRGESNRRQLTGFAVETKPMYMKKDAHYPWKVYALFVTPEQKKKMKAVVDWYITHRNDTSFNSIGLVKKFFNKASETKDHDLHLFCSQFVYSILYLADFHMSMNKFGGASLVSPSDLDTLSDDSRFYSVYQGGVDTYDKGKVDAICDKIILNVLPKSYYHLREATRRDKYMYKLLYELYTSSDSSRSYAMIEEASNRLMEIIQETKPIKFVKMKGNILAQNISRDILINESSNHSGLVPVFIILFQEGGLLNIGIRKFTNSTWTHSAISFDSSLDKMYTYNKDIDHDDPSNASQKTGFTIEKRSNFFNTKNTHFIAKVSALFVTPEQKKNMMDTVDWYAKHRNETSYSFSTCVDVFFNKSRDDIENNTSMICSQFVYSILKMVDFHMTTNKTSNLITPADLDKSDDIRLFTVYQDTLDTYNKKIVDRICNKIANKLSKEKINESTTIFDNLIEQSKYFI